ncbi:MAG: response regulator transcription factor [Bacilli bacterium]|jgi:two-component system alkaline phosphatase synthesis response regulator PhoP|nr:response regulator transcription factor [Bacilli bacterium]
MKKKICIIEDEKALQLLLNYELKSINYEVVQCEDGLEGLDMLRDNEFDLAIIDWMLPKLSGLDIVKLIRQEKKNLRIIMLTAKDNEMDIVEGLDSGADDYLTKPFSTRELKARINSLIRINSYSNLEVADIEINHDARLIKKNGQLIKTSKLEFDLIVYFINNKNKVLTRETIFNRFWKNDSDVGLRVVDNHIANIKRKFDLRNNIITKRGVGYIFVD